MRYGNTPEHLKRGMFTGFIGGLVIYVFSACMLLFIEHLPAERLVPLTFIIVLPSLVIGLAILPTVLFSIHIEGDWVEHRFLDRHIISRAPLSHYAKTKLHSFPFAAVLHFTNGVRIGIIGMHPGSLNQLQKDLKSMSNAALKLG